jgi:hypothetical protein
MDSAVSNELEHLGDTREQAVAVEAAGQVDDGSVVAAFTGHGAEQVRIRTAERELAHRFSPRVEVPEQIALHGLTPRLIASRRVIHVSGR